MINLAPFKYRNIASDPDSPIEKVSFRYTDIGNGETGYEAYAYLKPSILPVSHQPNQIYGNCDGGGTSAYKNIACYKAISEAIERWAFFECKYQSRRPGCGFGIDSSTTGMAAFPGISARPARRIAYNEACERWSLLAWWNGELACQSIEYKPEYGINGIEIITPFRDTSVVILWRRNEDHGFYSYGFAGNVTPIAAAEKAEVEQFRNEKVLMKYYESLTGNVDDSGGFCNSERRLLYFSKVDNYKTFKDVVGRSLSCTCRLHSPDIAIDERVLKLVEIG